MTSVYSLPSVFEGHNSDLELVSKDLLNGIKIFNNGDGYILGNLALSEGFAPHKAINSSPQELDYLLFLQAGLLLSNYNNQRPITLTTGFPFSTYQINRELAKEIVRKEHHIEYDASTFSNQRRLMMDVEVAKVDILSEMQGNITALRKGDHKASGDFFVVSLGYGTFEAVFSTENGIVQRTAVSTIGLQYAIDQFIRELSKSHYLGLKTKKQIDSAFQNDYIVLNRRKFDIKDIRKRVLNQYYEDIISPALLRAFNDNDFARANNFYITGGGALYSDLIDKFYSEFDDIIQMTVVNNPLTLTSLGYCLNSLEINGNDKETAVGLDIGNSNTVLTQFEEGTCGW